jgi:hypothetical protein
LPEFSKQTILLGVFVLLLKSLFCFTGSDNRRRFIIIHLSCYFLFAIISSTLATNGQLSFLTLCFFISIATFSTKRRLNDANLNINWLYAPASSFFITGLIIIFTGYSASYWLLLLPLMISALLMTYKGPANKRYILGYRGNIDLTAYSKKENQQNQTRIEPTFNQDSLSYSVTSKLPPSSSHIHLKNKNKTYFNEQNIDILGNKISHDIGEAIRLKLFNHKNALFTIVTLILLIIMAMTLTSVISTSPKGNDTASLDNEVIKTTLSQQVRLQKINFPDNFTLFLSSFDGITIKWQGDTTSDIFLWQQLTAQGDKTCETITFNNGNMIRTLSVVQENGSDYLATFSPLDTEMIIKNIAIRGSFSLCGYKFSLKGSQSVLGKHQYYSEIID